MKALIQHQNSLVILLLFAALNFFLQSHFYISGDVAYLLHATSEHWQGKQYGLHLFETNPPMILYLYTPVMLISNWTGLDTTLILELYVLALACFSILFTYKICLPCFDANNKYLGALLFITMLFCLLILPLRAFAQREHLFVILTLPYFARALLILLQKPVTTRSGIFIGCMAGLGVALKPYFLAPVIFIELYILWKNRRISAVLRSDTLSMAGLILAYLAVVAWKDPGYYTIMLPMIGRLYFYGTMQSWHEVFGDYAVIYCLVSLCGFPFFYRNSRNKELYRLLLLITLGMIFCILVTRTNWFYHVLPAMTYASLLFAFYLSELYLPQRTLGWLCTTLVALLFFAVPLWGTVSSIDFYLNEPQRGSRHALHQFIEDYPGDKTIICYSVNTTSDCFPAIHDVRGHFHSEFPFYWWARGLFKWDAENPKGLPPLIAKDRRFLLDQFIKDLDAPNRLLIVNTQNLRFIFEGKTDDWFHYYLQDPAFRKAFSHYHLLVKIGFYDIYQRQG